MSAGAIVLAALAVVFAGVAGVLLSGAKRDAEKTEPLGFEPVRGADLPPAQEPLAALPLVPLVPSAGAAEPSPPLGLPSPPASAAGPSSAPAVPPRPPSAVDPPRSAPPASFGLPLLGEAPPVAPASVALPPALPPTPAAPSSQDAKWSGLPLLGAATAPAPPAPAPSSAPVAPSASAPPPAPPTPPPPAWTSPAAPPAMPSSSHGADAPRDPGSSLNAAAGLWGAEARGLVLLSRLALGAALAGASHLALEPMLPMGPASSLPALAGAVVGWFLPSVVLTQFVDLRRLRIRRQLPDALDFVSTCLESGVAVERALLLSAEQLQLAAPELSQELGELLACWRVGRPRAGAVEQVHKRCRVRALRELLETLDEAARFGTPVADALQRQAEALRHAESVRVEEWSRRLPTRISIATLIFIVPPLFVLLLGSSVVQGVRALSGG